MDLKLKLKRFPHHSMYRRILTEAIYTEELEIVFSQYLAQLPKRGQEMVIVIDGKTVRETVTPPDPFNLHILATYLPVEGIVWIQRVVERD